MKIECDKCHAKYSIADEKVRGKTFKIRCKKCKNMIIVRGRTASEAAPAEPSEPAAPAEPGWHLAIDGETVGPISADEVRARYRAGEIDKETAVWTEGFENWVVLGEVEAFADLPDRPAGGAAASDPFAPSGEEAAFAPGEGAPAGGGVNFDQAAEEPEPQPQSPRVTKLTGQRNENSVLFSLDSLRAMATGGGGGGGGSAGRGGGATLATSAPSSEGSGLIDIRALGAMVGGGDAGTAPSGGGGGGGGDDVALPSFAGGGALGAISATPLVATPAAAAPAAEEKSKVMMYGLAAVVVVLLAAVGGLAYYVLTLEPQPAERVVIKEVPSVRDAEHKGAAGEAEKGEAKADSEEEGKAPAEEGASGGEAGGGEAAVRKAGAGRKGSRRKGRKASSAGGGAAAAAPASAASGSKPSGGGGGGDDLDVDCILDPSKCKTGSSKKKAAKKASSGGSTDPNAPTQLSTSDVRAGVNAVKSAAKACGRKHGAAPGTKVTVKLSISGATGRVQSATAQPPHGGTPLGNCVASALKKAKFRTFKKPVMGVLVPVRM